MLKKVILYIENWKDGDWEEEKDFERRLKEKGIILEAWEKYGPERSAPAETLFLTDRPELLAKEDACVVLYLTQENVGLPLSSYPYAVESLEGLDGDYLDKIYCRHAGIPWEILRTDRLIIREMEEADLDGLYEVYSGPGMCAYMDGLSENKNVELEKIRAYILGAYAVRGYGLWMLEEKESGKCIGRAGFTWEAGEDRPQLGFAVAEWEQRKGYAMEACRAILAYGFEELGFEGVEAFAAEGNVASQRVLAKLGFSECGEERKKGRLGKKYLMLRR